MLSRESLRICNCEEDEQGFWTSDYDGGFDSVSSYEIIGRLTDYLLLSGCTISLVDMGKDFSGEDTTLYKVSYPSPEGSIKVNADLHSNLITVLDQAVQHLEAVR